MRFFKALLLAAVLTWPFGVEAASGDVWSHAFDVRMPPRLGMMSRDHLAIREDGQWVFAGKAMLRSEPMRHDLVFHGPGQGVFWQTSGDAESPEIHHVQVFGHQAFALFQSVAGRCALAELGGTQFLWVMNLPVDAGQCTAMDLTWNAIHVLTSERQWFRFSLSGTLLGSGSLGAGTQVAARIRGLPGGGMLVSEIVDSGASRRAELSAWTAAGGILWQRALTVQWGTPLALVQTDGVTYAAAFGTDIGGVGQVHVWRGLVDGSGNSTQSFLHFGAEAQRSCFVGDELRILAFGNTDLELWRYPATGTPVTSTIQGLQSVAGAELACHGGRMFTSGITEADGFVVAEIQDGGTVWTRPLRGGNFQFVPMRANATGVVVVIDGIAADGTSRPVQLKFGLDGAPLAEVPMPDKRVDSEVFDLVGSAIGDPVVVMRHGSGLHMTSIDDRQGPGWKRTLAGIHIFNFIENDFYAIRRLPDGGVDFAHDLEGFHRLDATGAEYFSMNLSNDHVGTPKLSYLSNGDVLVRGGYRSVHRVRGNQYMGATPADHAVVVGPNDRVDVMSWQSFPALRSVWHELDGSFQPIPASRREYLEVDGNWILHPEGPMDFISGRSVVRYNRDGSLVFSRTHDDGPGGTATGYDVASAVHGIASVWSLFGFPDQFNLVRTRADGTLAWSRALPFAPKSLVMDADGNVGVAGGKGFASFAFIINPDGQTLLDHQCADENFCDRAVRAVGSEGGRWFLAGSRFVSGNPRRTFVSEFVPVVFKSGFEPGD